MQHFRSRLMSIVGRWGVAASLLGVALAAPGDAGATCGNCFMGQFTKCDTIWDGGLIAFQNCYTVNNWICTGFPRNAECTASSDYCIQTSGGCTSW